LLFLHHFYARIPLTLATLEAMRSIEEDYARYYHEFKGPVEDAHGKAWELERALHDVYHGPTYDEPYKLGESPNLQLLKDISTLLSQAKDKLTQFEESTKPRVSFIELYNQK